MHDSVQPLWVVAGGEETCEITGVLQPSTVGRAISTLSSTRLALKVIDVMVVA